MRKDAEVESQITKGEIEDHIPWHWNASETIQNGKAENLGNTKVKRPNC
jgi:hypothetical protein